ncbi:MAG: type II toxin-antitoxin system RelE/ParE family toxin [Proteobacteria bacterium]|nr:type II toxin-antitoxin system RelE/ParE family toxin [Pseudomonadota bacterium]
MPYRLHPEAALEHEEQAAWYESRRNGLGQRYHDAFKQTVARVCKTPLRYPLASPPLIRTAALDGFPFRIVFREFNGEVQILAVAHHRRRPGYWGKRV